MRVPKLHKGLSLLSSGQQVVRFVPAIDSEPNTLRLVMGRNEEIVMHPDFVRGCVVEIEHPNLITKVHILADPEPPDLRRWQTLDSICLIDPQATANAFAEVHFVLI